MKPQPTELIMEYSARGIPQHREDYERAPTRCLNAERYGRHNWAKCGKCYECKKQEARVLAHRIELEASYHEHVSWVTLTYDDFHLPRDGSVNERDVHLWLKQFRKEIERKGLPKIRYYYVAEYGELRGRPHYHVILYGYQTCIRGDLGTWNDAAGEKPDCCDSCKLIHKTWKRGRIDQRALPKGAAWYAACYASKAMTVESGRPEGCKLEFARWSRNPGLGSRAVNDIAETIQQSENLTEWQSAPVGIKRADSIYTKPLGKYLRRKVREKLGLSGLELATKIRRYRHAREQAIASEAAEALGTSAPELAAGLSEKRQSEWKRRKATE